MNEILDFIKVKKNLINLLVLLVLVLGIPIGFNLARQSQIFRSQAQAPSLEFAEGGCVTVRNGQKVATCPSVTLKLIAPSGGGATPTPSPE